MNTRNLTRKLAALAFAAAAFATTSAYGWQDIMAQNMAFDAQFNGQLQRMQAHNQAQQQQLWQHHLQVNGPRLRSQYQHILASGRRDISFEQFAYWDLMTAAGTNVRGALDAQRRQFEGNQRANQTVQQGYASYNRGWASNSERTSAALANYSNTAIRGNAHYRDPHTGQTYNLPYAQRAGEVYRDGHNYYVQDQSGTYYHWVNNGWQRLDAAR